MRLDLEEFQLGAGPNCPADLGVFQGYRLLLTAQGQQPIQLHRDQSIPSSRGCPLNYGISQVVTYHPAQGPMAMITLIDVFQIGFEGPDRRFLAVAKRLPQ